MKTTILFLLMIVSISVSAQGPIPCSACPQEVVVNVDMDTSIIEGQIDYGNGIAYQDMQINAQILRTQQDMLAEMKLQTKYQKQTRNATRVGAVAGVAETLIEGAGLIVDIKTLDELKDLNGRPQLVDINESVNIYDSYNSNETNNYNGGGGNGGGTFNLPGHLPNGDPLPTGGRGTTQSRNTGGTQKLTSFLNFKG